MLVGRRSAAQGLLAVVNGDETDDLEFLFAGRRGDLDFVADLAIEESTADGRSGGDKALVGVGFLAADELVFDFDVALSVQNDDAGAVAGNDPWEYWRD